MDFLYGLEDIISKFKNYCYRYMEQGNVDIKRRLGIIPSVLLYGMPGTGKTSLAYQVYEELKIDNNIDIYNFNFENMLSSNLGETSKNIVDFFGQIKDDIEKNNSYAFIIFDEMDSITVSRYKVTENDGIRRALLTFNKEIDNLIRTKYYERVLIIGISNVCEHIDTSLLRRFFLKINTDVELQYDKFREYINKLLDLANIQIILDSKQIESLYNFYREKNMTLGEVKSLVSHYYLNYISNSKLEFSMDSLNSYLSIYEQIEYQKEVFK